MVIDTLTSVREIMSLERSLKNRGRHLIQWRSMMLLIQVSPFLKVDGGNDVWRMVEIDLSWKRQKSVGSHSHISSRKLRRLSAKGLKAS